MYSDGEMFMENSNAKSYFSSLNGIRTYAAIAIVFMHVEANGSFILPLYEKISIGSFINNLTFLFMILSAFSLCCGYYDRLMNNSNQLHSFYQKRFQKVWPFFAIVCVLDFLASPSQDSLIELVADLTLAFGLYPNASITVLGAGWFIGVIFVFYMIFPFFCYLLQTKRNAWIAFGVTIFLNISCSIYFFDTKHMVSDFYERTSFIYCTMYFMAGGLIYLYKDRIIRFCQGIIRNVIGLCCFIFPILYLSFGELRTHIMNPLSLLIIFIVWIFYAISGESRFLDNTFTKFISDISLEIYLCHLGIFKIISKLPIVRVFGIGEISYLFVTLIIVICAIIFSIVVKKILKRIFMFKSLI